MMRKHFVALFSIANIICTTYNLRYNNILPVNNQNIKSPISPTIHFHFAPSAVVSRLTHYYFVVSCFLIFFCYMPTKIEYQTKKSVPDFGTLPFDEATLSTICFLQKFICFIFYIIIRYVIHTIFIYHKTFVAIVF